MLGFRGFPVIAETLWGLCLSDIIRNKCYNSKSTVEASVLHYNHSPTKFSCMRNKIGHMSTSGCVMCAVMQKTVGLSVSRPITHCVGLLP